MGSSIAPRGEDLSDLPPELLQPLLSFAVGAVSYLPREELPKSLRAMAGWSQRKLAGGPMAARIHAEALRPGPFRDLLLERWRGVASDLVEEVDGLAPRTWRRRLDEILEESDIAEVAVSLLACTSPLRGKALDHLLDHYEEMVHLGEMAKLARDGSSLRHQLDEARGTARQREAGLKQERRKLKQEVRSEREARQREHGQLRRTIERLESEVRTLRAEVERLRRETEGRERETRRLRAERNALSGAAGDFRREIRALGKRLAEMSPREEITVPRAVIPTPRDARPLRLPPSISPWTVEASRAILRARAVDVVVDGYNVTLNDPRLSVRSLAEQRQALVAELAPFAGGEGRTVTVVFDCSIELPDAPDRRQVRGVAVRFARNEPADDAIERFVAALPRSRPVAVVTSDRELQDRVSAHGANIVPSRHLSFMLGGGR